MRGGRRLPVLVPVPALTGLSVPVAAAVRWRRAAGVGRGPASLVPALTLPASLALRRGTSVAATLTLASALPGAAPARSVAAVGRLSVAASRSIARALVPRTASVAPVIAAAAFAAPLALAARGPSATVRA